MRKQPLAVLHFAIAALVVRGAFVACGTEGTSDTDFTNGGDGGGGGGGSGNTVISGDSGAQVYGSRPEFEFGGPIDSDGDGLLDSVEGYNPNDKGASRDTDRDGVPDYLDTDADGDGIPDARERLGPEDYDKDGKPNWLDDDSDGDRIPDKIEGLGDIDEDKWPNFLDEDSDQDGIPDAVEGAGDFDKDGVYNAIDKDSDNDGLLDVVEGSADRDKDGTPNFLDTMNDGAPTPISFRAISTAFNTPIGIDYHEPTNTLAMSVNYGAGGKPYNFERINLDGSHTPFSSYSGMSDEVKIATARVGTKQFKPGDLFVGNGKPGQIVRISDNGATVIDPWVQLPGETGLMRGSLYVDRTGVYNGDLLAVTTTGGVWRVNGQAAPTKIAQVGTTHLEGMISVPNYPARFGRLAGRIIAGAEGEGRLYSFDATGRTEFFTPGVKVEDIDLIDPHENYFGVNFGTSKLLGAEASQFEEMVGDILLTQESVAAGTTGLFRLRWNATTDSLEAQPIPLGSGSAPVGQWEHVTFAGAGILEVRPPSPPEPPRPPPPPVIR